MAEQERHDRPKVETSILEPQDYVSRVRRTSWGAVIAGVVAAASLQLLFTALGMAIGLTAARAGADPDSARSVGIAAAIWWLITGTISLFVGGWIAGRLSGVIRRRDGGLHGFVTWGAATIVAVYISTTALGDMLGGTMHAVTQTRAGAGQPTLRGGPVSDTTGTGVDGAAGSASERASAAVQQAQRDPEGTARRAAGYGAGASWSLFLGLLLGAVASAVGGYIGTPTEPPAPKVRATTVTRE